MRSSTDTILTIREVSVRYGTVNAVRDVSLEVRRGTFIALVGPSGCGKTSLLRAIAGFEPVSSGEILIDQRLVASETVSIPPEKRRVGLLFQNGALFPHMTVAQNVRYGVPPGNAGQAHAREALDVAGLGELMARYPDELSGGQQQRVALARAIAAQPDLILLDEPFANLDAILRQHLRDEVRSILSRVGITAVLVTHDQDEALSSAEEVAVMSHGTLLQIGKPDEIYRYPASLDVARFIGQGQLIECAIHNGIVETELGTLQTDATSGSAVLLVRPEQVQLSEGDGHIGATIVENRYHGHDRLVRFRLESGTIYESRALAEDAPSGSEVSVRLRASEYRLFSGPAHEPRAARVL